MTNTEYYNYLPSSITPNQDSNFGKLWSVTAGQYDDLDFVNRQLNFLLVIDKQSGVNLDELGVIVGELRMGRGDEDYRVILKTGIQRFISRGDLFSINEIGKALGASPLNIEENGDTLRLDGTWLLDGSLLLRDEELPARFTFTKNVNVTEDITAFSEVARVLEEIRAAGILAVQDFNFTVLKAQMLDYTQATFTGVLDGTWNLDGKLALTGNSTKVYTPNKIAVGDGAEPLGVLRPPQPTDTGLQNEVNRKNVTTQISPRKHIIELFPSENDGDTINEIGIFVDSSPILMGSFDGKLKNNVVKFIFNIVE